MQGFKPKTHKAQHLAGGGIVDSIKGMLGFKPDDPERAKMLAEYRANQEREKRAKQAQAKPAEKAISRYSGDSALQRRMKEVDSYKDGGMIRGKGTGTSDSIPRGFKPGTFIMPADSTKAIGPEVLENIAKVPTKVSNGEFAHTPQEVHAVGINALRQMKDATHNAKDDGVYFANGGMVDAAMQAVDKFGRSTGEYWSNDNAAFEATNPGFGARVVRAVNPMTSVGSAAGAMYDAAGSGDVTGAALALGSAMPAFAAAKALKFANAPVRGIAARVGAFDPAVVPVARKTAGRLGKNTAIGTAADYYPAPAFASGGQVRDPNRPDIPVVGTRGPVLGGGGGGLSREAVAQAMQPQAQQPAKYGVGALPANPVTQPGLILKDRERKAQGFAIGGEVTNDVTRIGNSYSGGNVGGNITVNGAAPRGFTSNLPGVPGAPNAAVQALPGAMPSPGAPTSLSTVPAAPVDSLTARNNAVSASSITNTSTPAATPTPPIPGAAPLAPGVQPGIAPPVAPKPVDPLATNSFLARNAAVSGKSITSNGGRFDRDSPQFADGGVVRGFKPEPQQLEDGDAVKSKQELYDDWQSKKAPWYLPTPRGNMEERIAEKAYTAAVRDPSVPVNSPVPAQNATTQNPTDMRLDAGTQTTPIGGMEAPSAPVPAPAGVTRTGNSYTGPANIAGDISVNGQAPRGSVATLPAGATPFAGSPAASAQGFSPSMGRISAQNMGAADNLAARGQMESMGRLMASGQIQAPGAGPSFIMQNNTGFRRDPRLVAPEDAARRALRYAQGDDPASRERKAKFQTAQLEQQGLAQRNQATNDIAQKELGLKTEAQGFTTRAAQQMEQLRNALLDPKATPEQRSQAQAQISALNGGQKAKDNIVTLGGGQEWDQAAGAMRNVPQRAIDLRTGQEIGGKSAMQAPKTGSVEGGFRFKGGDPANPKNWEKA